MLHRLVHVLWGDLRGDELKKFVLLSFGMFCIIGSYWPLKALKDSIFLNMVGASYLPLAKVASLLFFFPLVLVYSKLVGLLSRERMIYLLVGVSSVIGLIFSYYLAHPLIGVANFVSHPHRLLGWFFYIFAESYISLMTALFWSFVNDVTTPSSAEKGYGMIIFGSQSGGLIAMLISNYLMWNPEHYTAQVPRIVALSMVTLMLVILIVFALQYVVRKQELKGYNASGANSLKKEHFGSFGVGFFDGLRVLLTRPYVGGIFGLIFFHEFVATVMQYQMHLLVKSTYLDPALVTKYLMHFGLAVQLIACIFGLFGTSYFQRVFGIRFCLIAYPVLLGCCIAGYMFFPSLMLVSAVMLVAKAINYALNNPAKEVLYIPTSKNIKYKAKAWIDVFGARFAKGSGSVLNGVVGPLVFMTGSFALIVIVFWVGVAHYLGKTFQTITKHGDCID